MKSFLANGLNGFVTYTSASTNIASTVADFFSFGDVRILWEVNFRGPRYLKAGKFPPLEGKWNFLNLCGQGNAKARANFLVRMVEYRANLAFPYPQKFRKFHFSSSALGLRPRDYLILLHVFTLNAL